MMKIKKFFLNNLGIKTLSLLLAFVTWFYVGETAKMDSSEKTVLERLLLPSAYLAKQLSVKPIFVGKIPDGYRLLKNEVRVNPQSVFIIGPPDILSKREFVFTKPIDLSEHTKSKKFEVELASISRSVTFQKTVVEIQLPIEALADKEIK
ncbi:MAG: YbbR-like domain-containing protein [Candidatus Omnitrophota bacterium]